MADTTVETVKKTVETAANTVKASAEKAQATFQANAEQAQAAGAKAFRDVADKSAAGFTELNAQGKQNLEALVASAAAAQSISQARSIQELLELQTTWAKSATEAWLAEATKATDVLTASVKDSFKPINERVTASVEKFQAAR